MPRLFGFDCDALGSGDWSGSDAGFSAMGSDGELESQDLGSETCFCAFLSIVRTLSDIS